MKIRTPLISRSEIYEDISQYNSLCNGNIEDKYGAIPLLLILFLLHTQTFSAHSWV